MRSPVLRAALLAGFAAALVPGPSQAQAPSPDRQARAWAASCAACHGTGGQSTGGIPPIAGRDAEVIYRTLLAFKNNQRPAATVMHQHTRGYTDEELRHIAQHFAQQNSK